MSHSDDYLAGCLASASRFINRFGDQVEKGRGAVDSIWSLFPRLGETLAHLPSFTSVLYIFDDLPESSVNRVAALRQFLTSRGHKVLIARRGYERAPVKMEPGSETGLPDELLIPPSGNLGDFIPEVDVVVGTSWKAAWDVMVCDKGKPLVWETHEDTVEMFDDPSAFETMVSLPVPFATSSDSVADTLLLYGRVAHKAAEHGDVEDAIALLSLMGKVTGAGTESGSV